EHVRDPRARFEVGDAQALPPAAEPYDAAVSGLLLNFLPRPELAVQGLTRAVRPGGVVGSYVWDYAGRMELMRHFWDAAGALDPSARDLDEGGRFPLCRPEPLARLFQGAGLDGVATRAIDIPTFFTDFDDYWSPFLGGQGPAPGYAMAPRGALGVARPAGGGRAPPRRDRPPPARPLRAARPGRALGPRPPPRAPGCPRDAPGPRAARPASPRPLRRGARPRCRPLRP